MNRDGPTHQAVCGERVQGPLRLLYLATRSQTAFAMGS